MVSQGHGEDLRSQMCFDAFQEPGKSSHISDRKLGFAFTNNIYLFAVLACFPVDIDLVELGGRIDQVLAVEPVDFQVKLLFQ